MYPLTEVVYTRRSGGDDPTWPLIDLYRIGPKFDYQFTVVGEMRQFEQDGGNSEIAYFVDSQAPPTGRRRHNLRRLIIPCGLAVTLAGVTFVFWETYD